LDVFRRFWSKRDELDESPAHRRLLFPNGWSIGYSGNILANWKTSATNAYTVPIGVQVSKVFKFGALPAVKLALGGQWMPVHPVNFGQVTCLVSSAQQPLENGLCLLH